MPSSTKLTVKCVSCSFGVNFASTCEKKRCKHSLEEEEMVAFQNLC